MDIDSRRYRAKALQEVVECLTAWRTGVPMNAGFSCPPDEVADAAVMVCTKLMEAIDDGGEEALRAFALFLAARRAESGDSW